MEMINDETGNGDNSLNDQRIYDRKYDWSLIRVSLSDNSEAQRDILDRTSATS